MQIVLDDRRVDEAIADTRLGHQAWPGRVVVQLAPDLAGVDAEVLRLPPVLRSPHLAQQHAMRQHSTGMAGERRDESELLRRELDGLPSHRHSMVSYVDREVAHDQPGGRLDRVGVATVTERD